MVAVLESTELWWRPRDTSWANWKTNCHAGLVRAVRGKNGGYALTHPPAQMTLLTLLEALEGPLEFSQSHPADDAVKEIYRQAEEQIRKALDVPLSEVLQRQEKFDRQIVFHI